MSDDIEFEAQIHKRLLASDLTASEELAQKYLPQVRRHVTARAQGHGIHDVAIINDSTVEAVFDYIRHPQKFDPHKSGLLGYLKRAAERDLINEVRKDRRRRRGEELYEDVELSILRGNKRRDIERIRHSTEDDAISRIDRKRRVATVTTAVTNPRDQALLRLIASGERGTSKFAVILGIEERPATEQRRIVKQHKDRLKQQLKRLRKERHGSA